jgi:fimbrial isopeptide formation D2 family protein
MTTAAATTSVAPGSTAQITAFTLTNTSNDTLDFILTAAQQTGGSAQHGGTDVFDPTNVKIYLDNNANGSVDGGDTEITYLDEIAADTTKNILVVADIPVSQTNGQVAGIVLSAQAAAGGSAGSQGTVISATSGANTAGVDNVLADTAGATDGANDGKYSIKGDYTVSAAVLTITKVSKLISDPINNTSNPKAIPGATIEYCIVVSNAAGSATATDLGVSDTLPSTIAYASAYGIFVNGTATGTAPNYTCNADGTTGGSYNSGTSTVTGSLNNLAAGSTATVRFRATIN